MARPSQHVSRRAAATPQYYQDQILHGTRLSKSEQPIQTARQDIYLRALQWHCKEVEVHFGHFLTHKVQAPLANPGKGPRLVEVIKTEEKVSVSLKYD